MNHFMEIAKMRAARALWAKLVSRFNPKNPKSMALRTHSQTSGWSLTAQDPFNNVVRTCVEAMAAAMGHTQSLHTNALDEALALPTDFSARIARNTQIYLQEETDITRVVDPWGGSYYVETLTHELMHRAWQLIEEVEQLGGMAKAIETGLPKMRIEEAAARKQARIDAGKDIIVGINAYRVDEEARIDILEVDNTAVRNSQIRRLERNEGRPRRRSREAGACGADEMRPNRARATCWNSRWKRRAGGRRSARSRRRSSRCGAATRPPSARFPACTWPKASRMKNSSARDKWRTSSQRRKDADRASWSRRWARTDMTAGSKVIATAFADIGFDVDIGPLFQTPREVARHAVENDVHVVGASSLAAGHKTLVPQLIEELKKLGREDILVIVGGVIPPQDYDFLYKAGVVGVYGPGTGNPGSGAADSSDPHQQPGGASNA